MPDNNLFIKKSPLKFFLIVYGLSIPLWILETMIDVKGLPLDIPITDIIAAFTPIFAASILVYKEEGRIGIRHWRTDARDRLKKMDGVSEDDVKHAEKDLQKLHDDFISKLDGVLKAKEAEIMEV